MHEKQDKFYVTTPIYYVTAKPHLGSLYSTLIADVLARWNQLLGKRTYMLTGTDEHGQKIAQAAQAAGKEPQEFVDSFIPAYKDAWQKFGIHYDRFIRTTDHYHTKAVQQWLTSLIEKGDIYKSFYKGWYCTPCETFLTDKEAEEVMSEGGTPACPSCKRETHMVSEEAYFFKLSAYQDKLLAFYQENPHFITPKERLNEVLSFVRGGLKDLSVSRTTVKWGIPFPGDEQHVTYVWADALNNYITAIGYGQQGRQEEFANWWPADVQVLGKDIVRFHAVYWPAFLMASGLPVPRQLLVHGWIRVNQQKMSKSLGNVVDPLVLRDLYGTEPVRYYLMRQMAITHDGEFSIEDLEQKITADLANDLGNLLNRMVALAEKNALWHIAPSEVWSQAAMDLRDECQTMVTEVEDAMKNSMIHVALARIWKYINATNSYFHGQEPWKWAKIDAEAFREILSATCHSLRAVAVLAWPVMPHKMETLLESIGTPLLSGEKALSDLELGFWGQNFTLKKIPNLFEKHEPKPMVEEQKVAAVEPQNYITIDDLTKVELHVGTITACEEVPSSDKMLKMQVDLGSLGMRQILAGVKKTYQPADLIGKQAVFVTNLKPRAMLGMESQGMMLVAEKADGSVALSTVLAPVPNGRRLR